MAIVGIGIAFVNVSAAIFESVAFITGVTWADVGITVYVVRVVDTSRKGHAFVGTVGAFVNISTVDTISTIT